MVLNFRTYLAASQMARKSGNYNRAKALLTDYWKLKCANTQGFDSLEPNAGVDFKAEKETSKLFYWYSYVPLPKQISILNF
jgi:hypothetical protein